MKKVCAWCGKKLIGRGLEISHGICPKCFGVVLQDQFDFLEALPVGARRQRTRPSLDGSSSSTACRPVQADFAF